MVARENAWTVERSNKKATNFNIMMKGRSSKIEILYVMSGLREKCECNTALNVCALSVCAWCMCLVRALSVRVLSVLVLSVRVPSVRVPSVRVPSVCALFAGGSVSAGIRFCDKMYIFC